MLLFLTLVAQSNEARFLGSTSTDRVDQVQSLFLEFLSNNSFNGDLGVRLSNASAKVQHSLEEIELL